MNPNQLVNEFDRLRKLLNDHNPSPDLDGNELEKYLLNHDPINAIYSFVQTVCNLSVTEFQLIKPTLETLLGTRDRVSLIFFDYYEALRKEKIEEIEREEQEIARIERQQASQIYYYDPQERLQQIAVKKAEIDLERSKIEMSKAYQEYQNLPVQIETQALNAKSKELDVRLKEKQLEKSDASAIDLNSIFGE